MVFNLIKDVNDKRSDINPHIFGGIISFNNEIKDYKFGDSIKDNLIYKLSTKSGKSTLAFFKYQDDKGYDFTTPKKKFFIEFLCDSPDLKLINNDTSLTFRNNNIKTDPVEYSEDIKGEEVIKQSATTTSPANAERIINNISNLNKIELTRNIKDTLILNEGIIELLKINNNKFVFCFKQNKPYNCFEINMKNKNFKKVRKYKKNLLKNKKMIEYIEKNNLQTNVISHCHFFKNNLKILSLKKCENLSKIVCCIIYTKHDIKLKDIDIKIDAFI